MNKVIVTLFSFCLVSCSGLNAEIDFSYNNKAPCISQPSKKPINEHVSKLVTQSLKHTYSSPQSLWDQDILRLNPKLESSLQQYAEGKRGLSVKNLDITNQTPQYIHHKLLNQGFKHHRIPLTVDANAKEKEYWRLDGTKTHQLHAKNLVYMDVYSHKDGGIVRVKPLGIPDIKHPRPQPHSVKSVVLDLKHRDLTSWQNEAFKVTNTGAPIPKAPTREAGLKLNETEIMNSLYNSGKAILNQNLIEFWKNSVMDNAHLDVKVDFSHCKQ